MGKVTIYDIAEKLGVSTATVNRALNNKGRISPKTKKLVIETANTMGYTANKAAKSMARKTIRLAAVMACSFPEFDDKLIFGMNDAFNELRDFNVDFRIFKSDNSSAKNQLLTTEFLQSSLDTIIGGDFNGVIVFGARNCPEHIKALELAKQAGLTVATLVTDVPCDRDFHISPNGELAGRMAAQLLSLCGKNTPVAVFSGFSDIRIHNDTTRGFVEEAKVWGLELVGVFENKDNPEYTYENTRSILTAHPEIKGIYINSANSSAVCRQLHDMGLTDKVTVIASDLFPEMKSNLESGAVRATLYQNPHQQGFLALKYLYQTVSGEQIHGGDEFISPQIILRGNMDLFD